LCHLITPYRVSNEVSLCLYYLGGKYNYIIAAANGVVNPVVNYTIKSLVLAPETPFLLKSHLLYADNPLNQVEYDLRLNDAGNERLTKHEKGKQRNGDQKQWKREPYYLWTMTK